MKVILTQDVRPHGKKGDVINVSDGFATNFLIKKGLAISANAGNLAVNQKQKAAEEKARAEARAEAKVLAQKLGGVEVRISATVGKSGQLFGSITNKEIAEVLESQGFDVDKKKIALDAPIKAQGVYFVQVKLYPEISAKLKVVVE